MVSLSFNLECKKFTLNYGLEKSSNSILWTRFHSYQGDGAMGCESSTSSSKLLVGKYLWTFACDMGRYWKRTIKYCPFSL